jgi:restriction endonuclease S subunit
MILILCPDKTTDEELTRLKAEYIKYGIFVERNTKYEWEVIEKEVCRVVPAYPIITYPYYYDDNNYSGSVTYTTTNCSSGSDYINLSKKP